ncbi:hypothetical protein B0H11DRAFT_1651449, partial [Mycena galericulata]
SEVNPQIRINEALAWCSANRTKAVAGIADFNSCTKHRTPASSWLDRVSSDVEPYNTRGTWLLNTCEDNRLEILNGTHIERDHPGAYTSFQGAGKAVVDYALFSTEFLEMVPSGALQIFRVDGWSDHAVLALHVRVPAS